MHTITRFTLVLLAGLAFAGFATRDATARPDLPPAANHAEPRIALVIGNANYAEANKLLNPANDATLIGATLKQLGFDVVLVTNAAQKPMQRAIVDFGDRLVKAGPNAVGLFYYAGHGLQLDGENYLIPVDADIAREVDVELDGVSADLVLKQMAYAGSRVNIVILDACRNNPLARDYRSVATSQGFAEIRTKPKGTFISFSTAPGEVAVDGDAGHSPFAAALAQTMQQPGLDLPEVFQRVREKVLVATEERQTPWDSSSLVKSFYFIPEPTEPAEDALVAETAPAPAPVQVADAGVTALAPIPGLVSTADTSTGDSLAGKPVFVTMTRSLFAKSGSRLRAEPSTDSSVIAKLPANAEIRAVARSQDGAWYEVATRQGQTAYIHADAVSDYRAAPPPKRVATFPAYAAAAPKPIATARAPHPKTGIPVVDQALNWLSSNSAPGGSAPPLTRSSR